MLGFSPNAPHRIFSLPSNLDFKAVTDISCAHDFWPAKARREPPFVGSTVYYRNLVDRSIRNPDFDTMSPEQIAEIEATHTLANYSLNGYYGYAVILDVSCDEEELEAKHLIEPFKKWQQSIYPEDSQQARLMPPPVAPPCILVRRLGKAGETFLSIDAVLYLRSLGVQLVGVESSAIAPAHSHEAIESLMDEGDLSWLVRIDLSKAKSDVPYMLCAFPIEHGNTGAVPCRPLLIAIAD